MAQELGLLCQLSRHIKRSGFGNEKQLELETEWVAALQAEACLLMPALEFTTSSSLSLISVVQIFILLSRCLFYSFMVFLHIGDNLIFYKVTCVSIIFCNSETLKASPYSYVKNIHICVFFQLHVLGDFVGVLLLTNV